MKRRVIFTVLISLFFITTYAQNYQYSINLNNIKDDKIEVKLKCPKNLSGEMIYYFPKTVPGTYEELDYGRYISKFVAFDKNGNELKTKKIDINSFLISNATTLETIEYLVDDTFDEKVKKKHKIMEPAGTGFEKDKYFVLNNGGIFGCFEKMENLVFIIDIYADEKLKGFSSLEKEQSGKKTQFKAKNYHQLIDCPIFFTTKKTESFNVGNCKVTIASYSEIDSASYYIKKEIEPLFTAIHNFTGEFPVTEYNILVFIEDMTELGKIVADGDLGLFKMIKLMKAMNKGFGALEHGTSSVYYLPDLGKQKSIEMDYVSMIIHAITHEFMHIYTPLNLHSEMIGNFNYRNPKMSKHLWLYEGITEYFAVQILMQAKRKDITLFLQENIKQKIVNAQDYPDSISFTKMSANIFDKPYSELFPQVYQKGAVIAMLLDFEIMKLTEGNKTLKDVVFELSTKYGQDNSFDEENFISEFVSLVHPDLQKFFDDYITGTKPLDIKTGFDIVGINYIKEQKGMIPIDILSMEDNGVKVPFITVANKKKIKKVNKNDIVGFKKGDRVEVDVVETFQVIDCFKDENNNFVPEGTIITLTVLRNDEEIELNFPARYKEGILYNVIKINKNKTAMQQKLFDLWTKGK